MPVQNQFLCVFLVIVGLVFECSLLQLHSKSSVTFLFVHGRKHTVNSEKTLCLRKQFVNRQLQMMPVKETVNALNSGSRLGKRL